MPKWKKISTKTVFDHKYFRVDKDVVELPDGRVIDWFYWNSTDSAMIVALTADDKLIMIEQYRYLPDVVALEFPSGKSNDGETMKDCALREFEEETGYECETLEKVGEFYETMAQLNRKIHLFIARDVKLSDHKKRSMDENEDINVRLVDLDDAIKAVQEGRVCSMGTSLAILLARDCLKKDA